MSGEAGRRGGGRALLFIPLVAFLCLAVFLGLRLLSGRDPSVVPSALVGRPAPALQLPPLEADGRPLRPAPSAALLRDGKVSVINFWASWCAPCRLEHPLLMELARRGDVQVVGVNYKDAAENARRFLGQLGDPFVAIGVDRQGAAAIEWGVYGVPETFIVDSAGVVRHRHVGPLTAEALAGSFGRALQEAATPRK
ncbi:DsbE family thiol:disulfide interchange protein [Camelimonas abortus]|uniref:DsbE family thiol:disulfide interchange protein n=1 Tax=Camelimonas abortus TaxID=1017184 RepID=A0ABV7LD70_9HYPH